jgi:hypothetical protein
MNEKLKTIKTEAKKLSDKIESEGWTISVHTSILALLAKIKGLKP